MRNTHYFLGLDFGTSGARACVLDEAGKIVFESRAGYADPASPQHWRTALFGLIGGLPAEIRDGLSALAIDGTSGTLLATDAQLEPISPALLYNDGRAIEEGKEIARVWEEFSLTPAPSPAGRGELNPFGPTSGLAKRLWLDKHHSEAAYCFHQADWLAALLTGEPVYTDYHNALKSGYDVEALAWPEWVTALPGSRWQQTVLTPGEALGRIAPEIARRYQIRPECVVRAGTTDSIAAFIAAGASQPGEAVTSLGTTLVLKLLSCQRVEDPASGVYSHRFGNLWLAGGASNSGGGVLKQFFSDAELRALSARIDPNRFSSLDYYPLPRPGERFPINNPQLQPGMSPRPDDDVAFLHGLLDGMAVIEALGYTRLQQLGAARLIRVMTAGGGAQNPVWQEIRQRRLGAPVTAASMAQAAYGTARLAQLGTAVMPAG